MKFLITILLTLATISAQAQGKTWTFGLIGDVPYSDRERAELPKLLAAMAAQDVDLIAHIGDLKSSKQRCDDALFLDRFDLFNAVPSPFIFVPGDNEWLDCNRASGGNYDPQERLAALRHLFFAEPRSLGQKTIPFRRQKGDYVEHTRFRLGPVLFITLNVPGNNNNNGPWRKFTPEFMARNPLVLEWMRDSFKQARRAKFRGVVVLMQGNPHFDHYARGMPYGGYRALLDALREETQRFPGEVVLVHGDTHRNRIDKPLYDRLGGKLENFTRVETFGYPSMGWTQGIIDPAHPKLFRFEPHPWPGKGTMRPSPNQ